MKIDLSDKVMGQDSKKIAPAAETQEQLESKASPTWEDLKNAGVTWGDLAVEKIP